MNRVKSLLYRAVIIALILEAFFGTLVLVVVGVALLYLLRDAITGSLSILDLEDILYNSVFLFYGIFSFVALNKFLIQEKHWTLYAKTILCITFSIVSVDTIMNTADSWDTIRLIIAGIYLVQSFGYGFLLTKGFPKRSLQDLLVNYK